ncbi:MAG: VWA domain-containing protein [Anaerolineae bacterium]|nr:VWA domain-containing protein [Anaerolineae bacterium]
MKYSTKAFLLTLTLVGVLLTACSELNLGGKKITLTMVYGSEKEAWLAPLVEEFNAQHNKINGAVIVVEATPMGSLESSDQIVEEIIRPVIWSPASSAYIPVTNANWRQTHTDDLVTGSPPDLVLSPIVIAMWQPMAEALGWPGRAIGWTDIAQLAMSEEGWSAYGFPEWGKFKFGHTHPSFSNSGILAVIAEAYAGAGKQRGLTREDLAQQEVKTFMAEVESSIIHYGESTGFFATRMFERGPSYLSAAVLYENLVVAQATKVNSGVSAQIPVVAIYPKEGTFWSNHPFIVLNAPWVTEEQKSAAKVFEAFLLDRPQQVKAIEYGFRPSDPTIPFSAPLDTQHGVDPQQPQTVLEVPAADVIVAIQELWRNEAKKPVDLVAILDISGSMQGEKINAARQSLIDFVNLLDDRDRLAVILFSDDLTMLTPLSPMGEKRQRVLQQIGGIIEGGDTRLYDAIDMAYTTLQSEGDPQHIRAIVALTDGNDTASELKLSPLLQKVGNLSEGGNATKVFTIGFGGNADGKVLKEIAESTGAQQYDSDPKTIRDIYREIATFF